MNALREIESTHRDLLMAVFGAGQLSKAAAAVAPPPAEGPNFPAVPRVPDTEDARETNDPPELQETLALHAKEAH